MTSDKLTFIFGYRNRDLDRVARCLQSLVGQTRRDFRVIFVDYGSDLSIARSVQALVERFPFCRYAYTDTRGWPWSRSKVLNIGIRLAETDYVLTSDADMIFAPDFVETVLNAQNGRSLVCCAPRWLPETFTDWEHIVDYADIFPKGGHVHKGGCQCVPLSVMQELRGFDENLVYWGAEDTDLHSRLVTWGLHECWVDDETSIFHQWHPPDKVNVPPGYRTHWRDPYLAQVSTQLVRNDPEWGTIVRRQQRPLFDLLPEVETESIPDWSSLLAYLAKTGPAGGSAPRWLLTDRPTGPGWLAAAQAGYQRAVICAPWVRYLRTEEEIERRVERLFMDALANLGGNTGSSRPALIAVDVMTFLRISRSLFSHLLATLAPGGLLVIGNLKAPRVPTAMGLFGRLTMSLLGQVYPRLERAAPEAYRRGRQAWMALWATTRINNLCDSVHLAHIGASDIWDFTLYFPVAGATAIFLKVNGEQ
jgi:glycosyltransferase involved in cell wall biosynthesis